MESPKSPRTRLTQSWTRWAGTWEQVVALARLARDGLADDLQGNVPFTATVGLPGRVFTVESPDDLATLLEAGDLGDVTSVAIDAGAPGRRVRLTLSKAPPACRLEVSADDLTLAEGILARVSRSVERGGLRPNVNVLLVITSGLMLSVAITLLLTFNALGLFVDDGKTQPLEFALFGLILGAPFAVLWAATWVTVPLQILQPGEKRRVQRVRGWVTAAIAAIVLGLVVNVVWLLVGPTARS